MAVSWLVRDRFVVEIHFEQEFYTKMTSEILPFTRETLNILEPILAQAFGPGFDFHDEVDYFDPSAAQNWFYLIDSSGFPRAYIRFFNMEDMMYSLDFYAVDCTERSNHVRKLLAHFRQHCKFPEKAEFLVRLTAADSDIADLFREVFPDRSEKVYLKYALSMSSRSSQEREPFIAGLARDARTFQELNAIQNIMSCLKTYSHEQLQDLWKREMLYCRKHEGIIVSALHCHPESNDSSIEAAASIEIITLATAPESRNGGHAESLLREFIERIASQFQKVTLMVNRSNDAAIRLYEKTGFCCCPEMQETWIYLKVDEFAHEA
ncbi:MAG: hypothetical protein CVV64_18240 [Candidatus Wallbacteria bacterium HGW-Wallbacteria-1]|jgi:ribosomal protein S18 acetylase RimI-like enzyme|uniref:N-acetyltransferase domain-containing protein n=1 Tax=Candidatus Wallbacteria bacterium HGW-Wallbacteria-1 TaxID=2013854 RepID=A0A2N1PJT0_9BACT|nr:MAG: hypothetical protein CVV64_18240 [Candidatus Wallbacteria bacterium HGW-Wallbacteria-1]